MFLISTFCSVFTVFCSRLELSIYELTLNKGLIAKGAKFYPSITLLTWYRIQIITPCFRKVLSSSLQEHNAEYNINDNVHKCGTESIHCGVDILIRKAGVYF